MSSYGRIDRQGRSLPTPDVSNVRPQNKGNVRVVVREVAPPTLTVPPAQTPGPQAPQAGAGRAPIDGPPAPDMAIRLAILDQKIAEIDKQVLQTTTDATIRHAEGERFYATAKNMPEMKQDLIDKGNLKYTEEGQLRVHSKMLAKRATWLKTYRNQLALNGDMTFLQNEARWNEAMQPDSDLMKRLMGTMSSLNEAYGSDPQPGSGITQDAQDLALEIQRRALADLEVADSNDKKSR